MTAIFANSVGFWTLVKREMVRTFAIINQVVWPPVIQTLLYVFVFGLALGSQIKGVPGGGSYAQFLIPGLIMLQVIDQTYSESSSSVFQGRFMNSIQELLIAPLSAVEMVLGYVVSGVLRALSIAVLITVLGAVFVHTVPLDWGIYALTIVLVAVLFSALGIVCGLMAEKFDHIAVLTTFFITPLVFVGGVFTSTRFLPPLLHEDLAGQPDVPHDQRLPLLLPPDRRRPAVALADRGRRTGRHRARRRPAHDRRRLQAAHLSAATGFDGLRLGGA